MLRKAWYIVAYDISDPRRLQRLHRRMKKNGKPAQKSVFLVYGDESKLNALLDQLMEFMDLNVDDLRAYPITSPDELWTNGQNPLCELPLSYFGAEKHITTRSKRKPKVVGDGSRFLKWIFKIQSQ